MFAVLGDPTLIPSWYVLADEEILHWDPPSRYVYSAKGEGFPIRDYVACIEVQQSSATSGTMSWKIYCDEIDGEHFQRVLPAMLPAINEVNTQKLCPLIGGVDCRLMSYFDV